MKHLSINATFRPSRALSGIQNSFVCLTKPVMYAARAVWCHYHSCTLFGAACRGCGVRVHGLYTLETSNISP